MTTSKERRYAIEAISKYANQCPIVLWISIPCNGVSKHGALKGKMHPYSHRKRMAKHVNLLESLHKAAWQMRTEAVHD